MGNVPQVPQIPTSTAPYQPQMPIFPSRPQATGPQHPSMANVSHPYPTPNGDIVVYDPPFVIQRAKNFCFNALAFDDLIDHASRRPKYMSTPLQPTLPRLTASNDPDLWSKIGRIQTYLRADMSPYHAWPTRVLPLFSGEFLGIAPSINRNERTHLDYTHQLDW